jgi:hypothetical protein
MVNLHTNLRGSHVLNFKWLNGFSGSKPAITLKILFKIRCQRGYPMNSKWSTSRSWECKVRVIAIWVSEEMVDAPSDVAPEAPVPQWPNNKEDYELLDVIGQLVSAPACPCTATCASLLLKGHPWKLQHVNISCCIVHVTCCLKSIQNTLHFSSQCMIYMYIYIYRIAGNFRMVQIFAFFADRLRAAKIRTAKS